MKLYLDANSALNYDRIEADTSVQDLLDAIDVFLEANPLPCEACPESCCKKAWAVEVDNVAVRRIAGEDPAAASKFVHDRLRLRRNHAMLFNQYVLNKKTNCDYISEANRCRIYGIRPVICRLYVCTRKSFRYNTVRELIAATYLKALVMEQSMRQRQLSPATLRTYRQNPALFASDYSLKLHDVFGYAGRMGWLDGQDRREL